MKIEKIVVTGEFTHVEAPQIVPGNPTRCDYGVDNPERIPPCAPGVLLKADSSSYCRMGVAFVGDSTVARDYEGQMVVTVSASCADTAGLVCGQKEIVELSPTPDQPVTVFAAHKIDLTACLATENADSTGCVG